MALPIGYSFKSLFLRPVRTATTVGVIAMVVVACSLMLGLISSVKRTLVSTGDPRNLVVMRKGADSDGSSQVSLEAYQAIRFLPGIREASDGTTLVSPELVVQPFLATGEGGRDNVLVRGVERVALRVHDQVVIEDGRMFTPGQGEVVVGRALQGRYRDTEVGDTLEFGRSSWLVVGVMEAGGSAFESEIWADVRELATDARRTLPFSGIRLRAEDGESMSALAARIEGDSRFALAVSSETDYYARQGDAANVLYLLVVGIAVLAGISAGFGAANTMYAAVESRVAEIGTLRSLGFSKGAILVAFEMEALALACLGLGLGVGAAFVLSLVIELLIGGVSLGTGFVTSVVTLSIGPRDFAFAAMLSLAIGVLGGTGPAWRAAGLRPVEALRRSA